MPVLTCAYEGGLGNQGFSLWKSPTDTPAPLPRRESPNWAAHA